MDHLFGGGMRFKTLIIVVFGMMLLLQGCNTFKGAQEGFKKDWKTVLKANDWMKEKMW